MSEGNQGPGHPPHYKPEYCEMLLEHMSKGLSYESFAGLIGCCRKTLYNWETQFPEFLHTKSVGLEQSLIYWEKLGIDNIINFSESSFQGGSSSRSLNASVWVFNMKNRFKWRDKQPGEDGPAAIVNNNQVSLSDDQLTNLIKSARAK